jgi:hypothetical protein
MSDTEEPVTPGEPVEPASVQPVEAKSSADRTVPTRIESHGREVSRRLKDNLASLGRRRLAEELANGLGGPSLKHLTGSGVGDAFRGVDRLSAFYENSAIRRLAEQKNPLEDVIKSLTGGSFGASKLGAVDEHARQLQAWAKPLGGLDLVRSQLGADISAIGALARSHRWADDLASHRVAEMTSVLGRSLRASEEIEKLTSAAAGIVDANDLHRRLGGRVGDLIASGGPLERTALRMSLFAGALDVVGPRTITGEAAFDALLGRWRTRPDLPPAFWRSREARVEIYREADVDEGLIDADSATALEVLVETGVVEGEARRGSMTAVIEAGPVRMLITAGRTRLGAYRAIDAFEVALRGFVAAKLEMAVAAKQGDPRHWFKFRVPGDVMKRAKERRREAQKSGEPHAPLIAFTDLGDLIPIIVRNDNWGEAFEPVFINRDTFTVDMGRLTAARRPAMHARSMDAVRLVEAVCVIRRLNEMMRLDGTWDAGWDDDI